MNRTQLLEQLADYIVSLPRAHPLRVAIDGVDAAGKTVLANELVQPLKAREAHVIRASVDGFHNPRQVRYRRGQDSPEGYYLDSFDYAALETYLLKPLGPDGSLEYRAAAFDYRTDSPVDAPLQRARMDSILLFDGIFLLRPEIASYWDLSIFVHVDFDISVQRGVQRYQELFGESDTVHQQYLQRYVPGQRLYLQSCRPIERANIVIDNNDLLHPVILKFP